jgi:NADH-quinone oxidoreductase subunit C
MELETIKSRAEMGVPGCRLQILRNESASGQHSLLVDAGHLFDLATWLRDDAELRLDLCSNVTGVDWPSPEVSEKVKVTKEVGGVEQQVEEIRKTKVPGYLEVVYHLYSIEKKHGPLTLRVRTENRADRVRLASVTPVWRSAEFQEREIFDLYGVVFEGHPDLRRLLMWEGFEDHPMRRDYVPPDDHEYEPTWHTVAAKKPVL